MPPSPLPPQCQILIFGAGASGLITAVKLLQAGMKDFLVVEKDVRVGGTWRDNIYPGAASDIPSHLYTLADVPNPSWSRVYSPQAEIREYLEQVATKYQLYPHLRFGVEVVSANFDEALGAWRVGMEDGQTVMARFIFQGTGALQRPAYPNIPGLADFAGVTYHSARWRGDHSLNGRRVAVIGSAASAIQLVPPVAAQASQLFLFQRSANWFLPKWDRPYAEWEKSVLARFPGISRLYRNYLLRRQDLTFRLMGKDNWPAQQVEKWALRRMRRAIGEHRLHALMTPKYPIGAKRVLLSNDFYPALNRANVEVISSGLAGADAGGLTSQDGRHYEVDTILFATGFQVFDSRIAFHGIAGQALDQLWRDGPEAYKGVTVARFPNLFILLGPNSGLGHNSVWLISEAQADYAIRAIREVLSRGARSLTVSTGAMDTYNDGLRRRLAGLVWSRSFGGWYETAAGKNFAIYPGDLRSYRRELSRLDWHEYEFAR